MRAETRLGVTIALACAAVGCVVVGVIRGGDAPHGPTRGVRLIYAIDLYDVPDRAKALDRVIEVVRERVDEKGVDTRVARRGEMTFTVEVGEDDPEALASIKDVIARTAKLEIRRVDEGNPIMRELALSAEGTDVTHDEDRWSTPDGTARFDTYLRAPDRELEVTDAYADTIGCHTPSTGGTRRCAVQGRVLIEQFVTEAIARDPALAVAPARQLAYEYVDRGSLASSYWRSYLLEAVPLLAGTAITDAELTYDPSSSRPTVMIHLSQTAAVAFAEATRTSVGDKLAIVLDGRVKSAPIVNGAITDGRIAISMGGSDDLTQLERDAMDLIAVIKAGSLPAPAVLDTVEEFHRDPPGIVATSWPWFVAAALLALGAAGLLWSRPR